MADERHIHEATEVTLITSDRVGCLYLAGSGRCCSSHPADKRCVKHTDAVRQYIAEVLNSTRNNLNGQRDFTEGNDDHHANLRADVWDGTLSFQLSPQT